MVWRRQLLQGLERLHATTTALQRSRLADPLSGMWEAADVQWWWRCPRATDRLALPVWFDETGPVAAAGLTAWDDTWQVDVFALPSVVDERDLWTATLEAGTEDQDKDLSVLVREDDAPLANLAIRSGFTMTDELSGTAWMDAGRRPPVERVEGFAITDRLDRLNRPHPMTRATASRSNLVYGNALSTIRRSIWRWRTPMATSPVTRCSGSTTPRSWASLNRCGSRTTFNAEAWPACC